MKEASKIVNIRLLQAEDALQYWGLRLEGAREFSGAFDPTYEELILTHIYEVIESKMKTQDVLDAKCWAEHTFGNVQLHDRRRTRRTVQAASNLAENPLGHCLLTGQKLCIVCSTSQM